MSEGHLIPEAELTAEERQFAKDEGDGVWRTIRGRRVFIKKGETVKDALERSLKRGGRDDEQALGDTIIDAAKAAVKEKFGREHTTGDDDLDEIHERMLSRFKDMLGKHGIKGDEADRFVADAIEVLYEPDKNHSQAFSVKRRRDSMYGPSGQTPSRSERRSSLYGPTGEMEGVWRTVNGRKVFIKKGESATDAVRRSLDESVAKDKDVRSTKKRQLEIEDELEAIGKQQNGKSIDEMPKEVADRVRALRRESTEGDSKINAKRESMKSPEERKADEKRAAKDARRVARREGKFSDEDDMELKKFANTIKGVEIFAPGTHNGDTYSEADLDAIVASASQLDFKPALKLGHTKDKPGDPAYGYVENIRKEDGKLKADFTDVHDDVVGAIRKKMYDRVSSEIFLNLKRGGKQYARALKAVALLGSEIPAVAGLKPLSTLEFAESELGTVKCYELKLDIPLVALAESLAERVAGLNDHLKEFTAMDQTKIAEELAATKDLVTKLTEQLKSFTDGNATGEAERKKELAAALNRVSELEHARTADLVNAKVATIGIPAFRPAFQALYAYALSQPAGTKVKLFAADGKSEDKALVDVLDGAVSIVNDSAKKLSSLMTLSGQMPRAEGDTAQFDLPADEVDAKVKAYQIAHPTVKAYSEALEKVLGANPELAARYRASHNTEH